MTLASAEDGRDLVGPYRLLKAIGAGGSARIDLARLDRAYGFQRHVVLKRPLEHLREDPKAAASLRREARIGGQLRHPNLINVLDAGVHDSYDYLVLEYIHGASLRTLMQTDGPGLVRDVPLAVALAIVTDAARGLHHAHELTDEHGAPLGLVHRDVSPGNVLVGLDGTIKLADFGIATETRVTTLSGSMHGTVTYMAPEQCRGHAFDRRADVFSLGVILYELVTGTRLFWADNDVASLHRVLSGIVPRPRKLKPGISTALEDIVLTAVAADPERRYPTARALGDAIERHAATACEILTARSIARWAEEVLGPREVPWLGSSTIVEAVPRSEGSLVEIIAASGDDEPLAETFGPSGVADETAVDVVALPAKRRSRHALVATGLVLAAAVGATLFVLLQSPEPLHIAPPAPPSAPVLVAPLPTAATEPSPPPVPDPKPTPATEPAVAPVVDPAPPSIRDRRRHIAKDRRVVTPPPVASTPETKPDAPTPPITTGAGSGSASTPVRAKWDPTLLLPTDKGSGTKR